VPATDNDDDDDGVRPWTAEGSRRKEKEKERCRAEVEETRRNAVKYFP